MFAGVEGFGADDAWWETALTLEQDQLNNTNYSTGAADIYKCFDQLARPLLYHLMQVAGMPPRVIQAYRSYQEQLHIHNSLALGIGQSHQRPTGIPQGCPLSMMLVALLMRPWMLA